LLAGVLSALCLWFAWRAFRRCREIEASVRATDPDPLEQRLAEAELNLELNLAQRNVKALGRAALFGGAGLAFWAVATGQLVTHPIAMWRSFGLGLVGWGGCRELYRRIGSLAESWRSAANAKRRRRRQGVDPSERTG
jgi:hypothetical protein